MTKPMPLSDFARLPPVARAVAFDGLSGMIDTVADAASATHRFLRYQWFAAALIAYGGRARTIVVEEDGEPVVALPMVPIGPAPARLAMVPGSYWPFRSFPAHRDASAATMQLLLDRLAEEVNGLRLGPVYDDDPAAARLIEVARARGWTTLDRHIADSFLLDIVALRAESDWPRGSTLKKNRFHEKHLATHGALEWSLLSGAAVAPAIDDLAAVEQKSWIASRTDGHDAKFTRTGHGAFWRAVASDPALAAMMNIALLMVDGAPAAFSFDLDCGAHRYAIANSYDPAFAKHSPGKLLQYRNLSAAADAGIATVDWGAGDSGYKGVIGATKGPAIRDWMLLRPGLPAMLGTVLKGLWNRSGNRG